MSALIAFLQTNQLSQPNVDWGRTLLLVIAIVILGAVIWWITKKWGKLNTDNQSSIEVTRSRIVLAVFVLIAFLLVIGAGGLIYYFVPKGSVPDPEIEMGLMVVTAIAALMTLLFTVAAGFSIMGLTDARQPLGLPEGSIRAMIALILIMVFIIFGIYLFRMVGAGTYNYIGNIPNKPDPANFSDKIAFARNPDNNTYDVWLQAGMTDDGRRLAQQLMTTVGTLVVAVAGFYFGSTVVSSAVAAVQGTTTASNPAITDVSPKEGKKDETITLEIVGSDFRSPKSARLVRASEVIGGTEITSSATMIRCKIKLDKEPSGDKWDVVIENEDGKQARKEKIFTITS